MTDTSLTDGPLPDDAKSAPEDRETAGPLDEAEANAVRPYVDLGGVKIVPRPDLQLRLEVEEGSKRVIAVGIDYAGSTLQVQPFAAPRSSGLWHEMRGQITEQIKKQGGETTERDGAFGPEIIARIPVAGGEPGATRIARFIGVDGPRWFLRGVIAGQGAIDADAAAADRRRLPQHRRRPRADPHAAPRPHPAAPCPRARRSRRPAPVPPGRPVPPPPPHRRHERRGSRRRGAVDRSRAPER